MKKNKGYFSVKFSSEKIRGGISKWLDKLPKQGSLKINERKIVFDNESWNYDSDEEFFADFQKNHRAASYEIRFFGENDIFYSFEFYTGPFKETEIKISAPTRAEIEDVFYVFDKDWEQFKLPEKKVEAVEKVVIKPVIFIGHGKSLQWRDLKDHLSEKHGYHIEAYETGARAGHTIRDILDDMMTRSSIAFLILTGEDELKDGTLSPRPNVIHETGLFQGRLGFNRAIVLLEEGAEEFSNLYGIQQIRFSKGKIIETFGDVLATIKREFE
jgi:predicted nucleotide-binding protein